MNRIVIGVDEVGRGPLAGPVTVGAFAIFNLENILENAPAPLRDSKKLSKIQREKWTTYINECVQKEWCRFAITSVPSQHIDDYGIVPSIKKALQESLEKLSINPTEAHVMLDGGLSAPIEYDLQETIIQGDAQVPAIALASIVAKVDRDGYMQKMSQQYPEYGFDSHVGYGTKKHQDAIRQHGTTPIHRISFLKRLT